PLSRACALHFLPRLAPSRRHHKFVTCWLAPLARHRLLSTGQSAGPGGWGRLRGGPPTQTGPDGRRLVVNMMPGSLFGGAGVFVVARPQARGCGDVGDDEVAVDGRHAA